MTEAVSRRGWQELVKAINGIESEDARRVGQVLEEHNIASLMTIRHNVIHGRVSLAEAPDLMIVRHYRTGRGGVVFAEHKEVEQSAGSMLRLAWALEGAMPEHFRRLHVAHE